MVYRILKLIYKIGKDDLRGEDNTKNKSSQNFRKRQYGLNHIVFWWKFS